MKIRVLGPIFLFSYLFSSTFLSFQDNLRRIRRVGVYFLPVQSLEELVPIEMFEQVAKDVGIEEEVWVEEQISSDKILFEIKAGERYLGRVEIIIADAITFTLRYQPLEELPSQKLPSEVRRILFSSDTKILYEPDKLRIPQHLIESVSIPSVGVTSPDELRRQFGISLIEEGIIHLRPFAQIEHFGLLNAIRGKRIGRVWYEEYIEPYLRKCGFCVVAVKGSCWDNKDVRDFWHQRGFSDRMELQPYFEEHDEVQEFISFKVIANPSRGE